MSICYIIRGFYNIFHTFSILQYIDGVIRCMGAELNLLCRIDDTHFPISGQLISKLGIIPLLNSPLNSNAMVELWKRPIWAVAFTILAFISAQPVSAFYIPGFTAVSYKDGQQVQLDVNKIFSKNAQLPFAYSELDFVCQPKGPIKRTWLNLGEVLRGDRLVSSDFQVSPAEFVKPSLTHADGNQL
jgi:hypothetical protein